MNSPVIQNRRQSGPYGGVGRFSVMRKLSGAWFQGMAAGLVVFSLLPGLLSTLLIVAEIGADHDFRCSVTSESFRVVLVHDRGPSARPHHHNGLERVLICRADGDGEHSDHQFSFRRQSAFEPETPSWCVPKASETSPMTSRLDRRWDDPRLAFRSILPATLDGHPPEPPGLLRVGTVLRC